MSADAPDSLAAVREWVDRWRREARERGDQDTLWTQGVVGILDHALTQAAQAVAADKAEAVRAGRAEALREAADEIQSLHPGEVKASVTFLRARAEAEQGGGE